MESKLVNNLLRPECYPHEVGAFSVIETHIAWLVMTGEYVYKIKKPVNFGFLDFTTLEQRKFFCEEELRLNQRMSSDLYLEVVTIAGSEQAPRIEPTDSPIEYAVKLRQFESGHLLSELLDRHQFNPSWLDQLAEKIARFHLVAPIVSPDSPWGEPESIRKVTEDNYRHIDRRLISGDDARLLDQLWQTAKARFQALQPLLRKRKQEGFVRECHGDLHLGNITLNEDRLLVFDCIEFNLEFRWIDRIADLAFLLMDLEANGENRWANRCANRYFEITGDYQGVLILPYYKAHRAMVRAKVAMLDELRDEQQFRHYLHLTARYAQPPKPLLILMQGISGSGKSYLSSELAQIIGAVRVRSDIERKRIYRQASLQGQTLSLYGADMNTRTFLKMSEIAEMLIAAGQTVILDATFIKHRTRRHYIQMAEKLGYPVCLLSCVAPLELIQQRLEARSAEGSDPSDATFAVSLQQIKSQDPLSEDELTISCQIDTSDPRAVDSALRFLADQALLPEALN